MCLPYGVQIVRDCREHYLVKRERDRKSLIVVLPFITSIKQHLCIHTRALWAWVEFQFMDRASELLLLVRNCIKPCRTISPGSGRISATQLLGYIILFLGAFLLHFFGLWVP